MISHEREIIITARKIIVATLDAVHFRDKTYIELVEDTFKTVEDSYVGEYDKDLIEMVKRYMIDSLILFSIRRVKPEAIEEYEELS